MAFLKSEHFAQKHGGIDGLIKFIELCNKETDLKIIGDYFDLSASQVCRLRSNLCESIWRPKKGVIKYLEFYMGRQKQDNDKRQQFINDKTEADSAMKLQLIMGKTLKWIK